MLSESEFRDERVGFDDIVRALRGLGLHHNKRSPTYPYVQDLNPEYVARQIIEWVHDNREPEYTPGEIYRDAHGTDWLRKIDAVTGLVWFNVRLLFNASHDIPPRPLFKLVPEEK